MTHGPLLRILALSALCLLAACANRSGGGGGRMSAQECLTRAMYFESNRSSEEGMLAVGTVVMNRVNSGRYPKSVCGVVGQKNQFAPGVLSKKMGPGRALAENTARKVLRGGRHSGVQKAMFFHTAGHSFPYTNMHYVAIAGGNAFYEKRKNATATQESVSPRRRAEPREASRPSRPPADPNSALPRVVPRPAASSAAPLAPMSIEDLIRSSGGQAG